KNKKNALIDNIIIVNRDERATYGDFFRATAPYSKDVNIIANTDIYFDETIELASQIKQKQCYALTRWELYGGTVISFTQRHGRPGYVQPSPPEWSQDTWIFRGAIRPESYDNVIAVNNKTRGSEPIPFYLGIPGCDNKIAALLREKDIQLQIQV
ncbi:MAG: hypothetical protein V3W20_07520, partial [Candidatus Neomarinimicrobiota bacterium]